MHIRRKLSACTVHECSRMQDLPHYTKYDLYLVPYSILCHRGNFQMTHAMKTFDKHCYHNLLLVHPILGIVCFLTFL